VNLLSVILIHVSFQFVRPDIIYLLIIRPLEAPSVQRMIADVLFTSKIWTPPKCKFQIILLCELFQVLMKRVH